MSEREQIWRERIESQQRSGQTVAECCRVDGVSVGSFYRWRKLLMEADDPRRRRLTRRSDVRASGPTKPTPQFVPIALRDSLTSISSPQSMPTGHGSSMRIELPNGVVIHVAGDLDGQRLSDVVVAAGQINNVPPDATTHGLHAHEVPSC